MSKIPAQVKKPWFVRLLGLGRPAVFSAARRGHTEKVRSLLEADRGLLSLVDADGRTALHLASMSAAQGTVALLLERGANVGARDNLAMTPLHLATVGWLAPPPSDEKEAREAAVRLFSKLEHACGKFYFHPLTDLDDRLGVIRMLLERGANPNAGDSEGSTPLHCLVARYGQLLCALEVKADYLVVGQAARHKLLPYLRGREAPITLTFSELRQFEAPLEPLATQLPEPINLFKAVNTLSHEFQRLAEALIGAGAAIESRDGAGRTPLLRAAAEGWILSIVSFLLDKGADVNAQNQQGETPLHALASLPPASVEDLWKWPELVQVVRHRAKVRQAAVGKLLIQHGADVKAHDAQGRTALEVATAHGHVQLAEILSAATGPEARRA